LNSSLQKFETLILIYSRFMSKSDMLPVLDCALWIMEKGY